MKNRLSSKPQTLNPNKLKIEMFKNPVWDLRFCILGLFRV
jgi:hypothetical protein